MKRYAIPETKDFEDRQMTFDFAIVARAVAKIVANVAKSLRKNIAERFTALLPTQKQEQLPLGYPFVLTVTP